MKFSSALACSMICPRCGKFTDEAYPNCVNCGYLIAALKPDETVDTFAKILIWLIVIAAILSTVVTIIMLVFVNNMMHSIP